MPRRFFLRNVNASDQLELFLVAAVASLLSVRAYLYLADYPQIGGGGLHIAHMLWGGLLMLVAMVLLLSFIGQRIQRLSAFIGGIGFGIFIDELGKFVTRDNDYFFQPTIALIYALFIGMFLLFRFLGRQERLTDKEYLLNALTQLEDIVLDDFDMREKKRVEELLQRVTHKTTFTKQLHQLVDSAELLPYKEQAHSYFYAVHNWIDKTYRRLLSQRYANRFVSTFFMAEAILFLFSISLLIFNSITNILSDQSPVAPEILPIAIAEAASAGIAALFVLAGVYTLRNSRLKAYRFFLLATTTQILLTNFFMFYRDELGALPALIFNLIIFTLLRAAIEVEKQGVYKIQPTLTSRS